MVGVLVIFLCLALAPAATRAQAGGSSTDGLYIALGDSVMSGASNNPDVPPTTGFPERLFVHYQSSLGVTALRKLGANSSEDLRTGGALAGALEAIDAGSDTRVVTLENGGHDALAGCDFTALSCPFRANLSATLGDFQAALANDPGAEPLIAMAYYNPAVGTAGEARMDQVLLGASASLNCTDTGAEVGLNDVIAQESARHQALLANPYPAFRRGGPAWIVDGLHPGDEGQAAITEAFVNAAAPCVAPRLELKARDQKLKDELAVSITVDIDSTVVTTGKAIKKVTEELAANEKTTLTATLKPKQRRKLAQKLDRKGKAKTSVEADVVTAFGGTATDDLTVRFRD